MQINRNAKQILFLIQPQFISLKTIVLYFTSRKKVAKKY